jgi:hypothetical protein
VNEPQLHTRWSRLAADDCPAQPLPTDPDWSGGSLHEEVVERRVDADTETVWRAFESVGAERGLSVAPRSWALRGWFGVLARAAKHRRTSSGPHHLHSGEELDWWLVEHMEHPHLLRLRANVSLPGRLWLELSVRDDGDGGSRYRQRALFQPYGLGGEAWWAASFPFRHAIFGGIARDITSRANGAVAATRA